LNRGKEQVSVVIPCYRAGRRVLDVLDRIGPEVSRIYVVDDACPEATGDLVEAECRDPRVEVLRNESRRGVGGATLAGFARALHDAATILVKIDGDGQMDPTLVPRMIGPIVHGAADATKGNRFYHLGHLREMPAPRLAGNAVLSFVTKLSTGYWDLFDPTNGFLAIDAGLVGELPLHRLSEDFFFESDLLFHLGTLRAVVSEVPMPAHYGDEESNLRVSRVAGIFLRRHARNIMRRIFYNYFLRGFSLASVELVLGLALMAFGFTIGSYHWIVGTFRDVLASSGTVMLAALPLILGMQLLLAFLSYDIQNQPRTPCQQRVVGPPAG
jgi:glycosyltransferase involved in cell wall biosynthesis